MLHRAIAYIDRSLDDTECVVFFEHYGTDDGRTERLKALLSTAWRVSADSIVAYNVDDERSVSGFSDDVGDTRLFESGWSDGAPVYHRRERTMLLVGPTMLRRLVAAQRLVDGIEAKRLPLATQS